MRLNRSPGVIGAPALWGPNLSTAGQGIKIGIVDQGIDQKHPFFDPSGFTMPPGFPKGNVAYTTAKVIVARTFLPASRRTAAAARPFIGINGVDDHGTHVAGIAAGDNGTSATLGGAQITGLSGVAPKAYLGNYKALAVATPGFGLDGNSPELAAAIEAAVRDGMDVVNLSLGEPEVDLGRDLVVQAIEGAAAAGVVPAVAAGNDFDEFGFGSIDSPGSAPDAITAAAASKNDVIADFSSAGPTPLSLQLKPDVTAPGVGIVSSVPAGEGLWDAFNGTSMASPHVAGSAALLLQRHPGWTPAQVKSALVTTAGPVYADESHSREVPTTREGGGLVNLPRANDPLLFAAPTSLAFGLLRPGATVTRELKLTDAGGGAGPWTVAVGPQITEPAVTVSAPASLAVPGTLTVTATVATGAAQLDLTGFVILNRGDQTRRVPYWLRVETPALAQEPATPLTRQGVHSGTTAGKPSLVSEYRYPAVNAASGAEPRLPGPEQVFGVHVAGRVANFGVVVTGHAPGVKISPRVVVGADENRLAGYTALPLYLNPFLTSFGNYLAASAAVLPAQGNYEVVFDTPSAAAAGAYTFRFWVNDTTPPRLRLLSHAGGRVRISVTDAGSGVDPSALHATVDGRGRPVRWASGIATIAAGPGRHVVVLQASDYQEAKNTEDVPRILPNTSRLRVTLR